MERKHYCKACSMYGYGVKTRKSIPHTCNKHLDEAYRPFDTKEEYDKALNNLLELITKEKEKKINFTMRPEQGNGT